MAQARCPRCGGAIADSASACAGCARPVTLDLTARVPKKQARVSRRPLWRDGVLLLGGAGGIAAASVSDRWWLAGGVVAAAVLAAVVIHYGTKD
ncbi:MAG TPA: hypothetical protein VHB97_09660 [Polyangia bacterium]|jgi:hypothetical protein|nr:hypothetical protein [Polyangia bacterium]